MRHHTQHLRVTANIHFRCNGDIMAFFDRQVFINFNMDIHQQIIAGLTGFQIMHPFHSRGFHHRLRDSGNGFFIRTAIHQILEGLQGKFHPHAQNKQPDHQRGDRIQNFVPQQTAGDTDGHHQ